MSQEKFSLNIRGQAWEVKLLTVENFIEIYGDNVAAVTDIDKKILVFNEEDIKLTYVLHELTHAYFSASHVISAALTPHQVEEVMCEVMGEFGAEIVRVGRKLTKYLKILSKNL